MNWLIVIPTLIVQEVVSLNTVLFEVHQQHFHILLVHLVFVLATVFDIVVGYVLGKYLKKKMTGGKVVAFADKLSAKLNAYAGKKGRWVMLLVIGNFSFPYVNAFLAAWLDLPFWESFIFIFLGDMVYYAGIWLLILGVVKAVPGTGLSLGVLLAIVIVVMVVLRALRMRRV